VVREAQVISYLAPACISDESSSVDQNFLSNTSPFLNSSPETVYTKRVGILPFRHDGCANGHPDPHYRYTCRKLSPSCCSGLYECVRPLGRSFSGLEPVRRPAAIYPSTQCGAPPRPNVLYHSPSSTSTFVSNIFCLLR
jgi:hypothetical protein